MDKQPKGKKHLMSKRYGFYHKISEIAGLSCLIEGRRCAQDEGQDRANKREC